MTQREMVEKAERGYCREVYTPRGVLRQGWKAQIAYAELMIREGKPESAHATLVRMLDER
jgi:hypothetical protein